MIILGIETSCDETGIAIYDGARRRLLADVLYSQIKLHAPFGGVVPELASREHIERITPLTQQVLEKAGLTGQDLDAIAYTAGPGLMGTLMVGAVFARTLAYAWNKPAIAVHHMEGHLLAPMLEENRPSFPFVALLVSGGHTQLIAVENIGQYQLLGDTLDYAVGEAFDKVAKMLQLGYPGGPQVEAAAKCGTAGRFTFPRPMVNRPGLDFSFSGLKTRVLQTIHAHPGCLDDPQTVADIALAFQQAVTSTLAIKCKRALKHRGWTRLVVAGGVSANQALRQELADLANELNATVHFPRPAFCTDNGAMIAYVGYCRFAMGCTNDLAVRVHPRWPLTQQT